MVRRRFCGRWRWAARRCLVAADIPIPCRSLRWRLPMGRCLCGNCVVWDVSRRCDLLFREWYFRQRGFNPGWWRLAYPYWRCSRYALRRDGRFVCRRGLSGRPADGCSDLFFGRPFGFVLWLGPRRTRRRPPLIGSCQLILTVTRLLLLLPFLLGYRRARRCLVPRWRWAAGRAWRTPAHEPLNDLHRSASGAIPHSQLCSIQPVIIPLS